MIPVACLVMQDNDGFILATQRSPAKSMGLLWEFPGGKVEDGEEPEDALRREIIEELSLDLGELTLLPKVQHDYDFGTIHLIPFLFHCDERPDFKLNEHNASKWIELEEWESLNWAPADVPVINYLLNKA